MQNIEPSNNSNQANDCIPPSLQLFTFNAVDFGEISSHQIPSAHQEGPQMSQGNNRASSPLPLQFFEEFNSSNNFQGFDLSYFAIQEMELFLETLQDELLSNNTNKQNNEKKKKIKTKINRTTGKQCSICFQTIRKNSRIPNLKCKHMFHQKCLQTWAAKHNTCPLCRSQMAI